MKHLKSLVFAGLALAASALVSAASAAELRILISGGMTAAYKELAPEFERATGHQLTAAYGPSMGTTENAIPQRLARGEPADVLILVGDALGKLIDEGKAVAATRVDLVRSRIGVSVRVGAPKPDISTPEALKKALLGAKSVAYSDSASGVYVESQLFKKLGIEAEMRGKARRIPAEPVAAVVARGEAEIGFQQVAELLPVPGAEFVGPIPAELQKITVFSAAVASNSQAPEAAEAFIAFLASPAASPVLKKTGLDPIDEADRN
jgi:molybdate transport system substrate-binding protein